MTTTPNACPLAPTGYNAHNYREAHASPSPNGAPVIFCQQCGDIQSLTGPSAAPAITKTQPVASHDPLAGLNP